MCCGDVRLRLWSCDQTDRYHEGDLKNGVGRYKAWSSHLVDLCKTIRLIPLSKTFANLLSWRRVAVMDSVEDWK
jgi:hypothetical protein